tara:strand:- start:833 stop:1570 length:738 start_codon:yes stop_codon:yes gene_type:complete
MDLEELISEFSKSTLDDNVINIQKIVRGFLLRRKRMPLVMYIIKKYLENTKINISKKNKDGRVNSSNDEDIIIEILMKKFKNKIIVPSSRMWYDILVYDNINGYIPVNIKSTTTKTSDNIGNLATCVYAYTNEKLELEKHYSNGRMSKILFDKLKKREYNKNDKKDYYFLVINKNNTKDIIINSIKGLSILTSNINNLPYQICWNKNRYYVIDKIENKVKLFIDCIIKPKPSWKEDFLRNIRKFK